MTSPQVKLLKRLLTMRNRKYTTLCLTFGLLCIIYRLRLNEFRVLWDATNFEITRCSPCEYITTTHATNSYLDVRYPMTKRKNNTINAKPKCKVKLVGTFAVDLEVKSDFKESSFHDIRPGGTWKPSTCVSKQRVAIIIPYRDRQRHLQTLLYYLIPVLKRQQLEFTTFVVEQYGEQTFNKGVLLNAGFLEAWNISDFDCFIFHDVDLIPEDDRNLYTCEEYPKHMSPEIDKFDYKLPYVMLVGGVLTMPPEIYLAINGYSNLYWGWGGEDDDMAFRLYESKLGVIRPPNGIGRYKMFRHGDRESSPHKVRYFLMRSTGERFRQDGVNSVKYKLVHTNNTQLYTHLMIDVGTPPSDQKDFMNYVEQAFIKPNS